MRNVNHKTGSWAYIKTYVFVIIFAMFFSNLCFSQRPPLSFKRLPPKDISPIELNGQKFEILQGTKTVRLGIKNKVNMGGLLQITDISTGGVIKKGYLFQRKHSKDFAQCAQEVFVTAMIQIGGMIQVQWGDDYVNVNPASHEVEYSSENNAANSSYSGSFTYQAPGGICEGACGAGPVQNNQTEPVGLSESQPAALLRCNDL